MDKFSESERRAVLKFVRGVLEAYISCKEEPAEPDIARLREKQGCFVSIFEGGSLRGCIGSLAGVEPLGRSMARNVVNAACADPSIPPPSVDELPDIAIELSFPGECRRINSADDILNGIDGVVLKHGGRQVLFLPQVISRYNWDNCEILHKLSEKAQLPAGCLSNEEVEILVFRITECFGEEQKELIDF